jgi:predicted O-methyltransferase YrrM
MNTRYELTTLIPPGGTLIELGVAAGKSAQGFLIANPSIRYIGIDRWSDHHDEQEMDRAMAALWPWRDRVGLHRMTFECALSLIPDRTADMIYIDGYAHTGQEGGETLAQWWPKLKPGGIFAGHDYHYEYEQTINAVDAFTARHGLDLRIIEDTGNKYPSWWMVRPTGEG